MKYAWLSLFLFSCASQGHFIDLPMANTQTPFVHGVGGSPEEAERNARKAIPPGYDVDYSWSSAIGGCEDLTEVTVPDAHSRGGTRCPSGRYQVSIPVLQRAGVRRENVLAGRESFKTARVHYRGVGNTPDEAKAELRKQIPANAVVETWFGGCTGPQVQEPSSQRWVCDPSVKGNRPMAEAIVMKPNAVTAIQ
jgi:hypothetical protein